MRRVLVTGGAGFIGSHVIEALIDHGLEPLVFDLRPPHIDVEYIQGDIRDPEQVRPAVRDAELVCHLAARVGLSADLHDLPDYAAHNDLGTAVLLQALVGARPERLILASSMVVYGEGRYRCLEHGLVHPLPRTLADLHEKRFDPSCPQCGSRLSPEPIPEEAPTDPRSVYAATKLHQEQLALIFARETGTPTAALRYHNAYGPRMPRHTQYAGVAALFADSIAAGRPPRVFEDGAQLRDFVHVRDVARATVMALTTPQPVSGPINVCSGRPRTVGELATALHAAAPSDSPPPIVSGEFRLGDVRHVFADPGRAHRHLGFRASEDFHAGLAELTGELGIAV